jgi:galactose mutarotase-like enzyme
MGPGQSGYDVRHGTDPDVPALASVTLVSPGGVEAVFVPGAGMVGTSLTLDGAEVLARRGGMTAYLDHASTFGIPLLAPWANRLSTASQGVGDVAWTVEVGDPRVHGDDNGHPIHGLLAGASEWVVEHVGASEDSAVLRSRLRFDESLDCFAQFPFRHDLVVTVELEGSVLRVTTELDAVGDVAVPVAFGWHPWFDFPAVPRAEWEVHGPLHRRATLDAENIPTGEVTDSPLQQGALGDTFLDDVFLEVPDGTEVSVAAGDLCVVVRYVQGYDVAVVFAPLVFDTVCVEPMTAPTDPFRGWWPLAQCEPGETVTAVYEIELRHRS